MKSETNIIENSWSIIQQEKLSKQNCQLPPKYTEGIRSRSLADNISVLANAQKKKDYEEGIQKYMEGQMDCAEFLQEAYKYLSKVHSTEESILSELRTIPGSESFVGMELSN